MPAPTRSTVRLNRYLPGSCRCEFRFASGLAEHGGDDVHAPARELSSGSWPAGPFDRGSEFELAHARLVAQLATALTGRREQLQLSRAALARRAGVAAHTVGRIEAGQSWPDLGLVARLAHVLGPTLTIDSSGWAETLPTQRTPPAAEHTSEGLAGGPLALGLGPW